MSRPTSLQVAYQMQSALGVAPSPAKMQKVRVTSEAIEPNPSFGQSDELRDDRLPADLFLLGEATGGSIGTEMTFGTYDDWFRNLLLNDWSETPVRQNVVGDDIITDVAAISDTFTVTTEAAFAPGHLVRATGFAEAANNGVFQAQAGSNATALVAPDGRADEATVPAAARLKVVGFFGETGDIVAVADGLTSTALDFTTITGLAVNKFVKIGGAAAGNKFDTASNNKFGRIVSIEANKITLDHLPVGWSADAGTGKKIYVFFPDVLEMGSTIRPMYIESVLTRQATPAFILHKDVVMDQLQLNLQAKQKIDATWQVQALSTNPAAASSFDASPLSVNANPVMTGAAQFGAIYEAGGTIVGPNYIQRCNLSWNNQFQGIDEMFSTGFADMIDGEVVATLDLETLFGTSALWDKARAGSESKIAMTLPAPNHGYVLDFQRVKLGSPSRPVQNKTTPVSVSAQATVLAPSLATDPKPRINRFEYWEHG